MILRLPFSMMVPPHERPRKRHPARTGNRMLNGTTHLPVSAAFTLMEVLLVVVVLFILVAAALPWYFRSRQRTQSVEAITNLSAIRTGELAQRAQHGTFVEALDLPAINAQLELDLSARYFDYEIATPTSDSFIATATSKDGQQFVVAMDHTGQLTYTSRPGSVVTTPPVSPWRSGETGGGSGGGGGSRGGGSRKKSSGGGGGGGGGGSGGDQGGGSSGGGGGGSSGSGGTSDSGGSGGGSPGSGGGGGSGGGTGPRPFTYIARGDDSWTDWPDQNVKNISGTAGEILLLTTVFDTVATSSASFVTSDLFARGTSISFGDPADFTTGGICEGSIACHLFSPFFRPPAEPGFAPVIIFNPTFSGEDPGVLAAVLVHEGTHFEQYLDGTALEYADGTISVIDIEFTAWWNAAVYWEEVRSQFSPIDTVAENTLEIGWEKAKEGEAALRDLIAPLYT